MGKDTCSSKLPTKLNHVDGSIPKEFLDSLTLTLIKVPMVLPCGQVIDRKNLDTYLENEAKYGRPANDPYTGRPFTKTSYPIFDDKLKCRIDEYVLLKNGVDAQSLREKRKFLIEKYSTAEKNNFQSTDKAI